MSNAGQQRPQRNFLKVYNQLGKAMRFDYIGAPSFMYSGYGTYEGMLETLNPLMFESASYCDRTLTQLLLEYLSWYDDPCLLLSVGEGSLCRPTPLPFTVQAYDDALYVVKAEATAPYSVGDRIVSINGKHIDEVRPEVERVLRSTIQEREDWSVVLAFAKRFTVQHDDGTCDEVDIGKEFSGIEQPSKMARAVQLKTSTFRVLKAATEVKGSVGLLTIGSEDTNRFALADDALIEQASQVDNLIIDVRACAAGDREDLAGVLGLLIDKPLTRRDAWGTSDLMVNYSRHNVKARLDLLDAEAQTAQPASTDAGGTIADTTLDAGTTTDSVHIEAVTEQRNFNQDDALNQSDTPAAQIDTATQEYVRYLTEHMGDGLVLEAADDDDEITAVPLVHRPRKSVIVCGRETAHAGEWLVRAASVCPHVTTLGRATRGSIDHTCLLSRELDNDFALVYPTAIYRWAYESAAGGAAGANNDASDTADMSANTTVPQVAGLSESSAIAATRGRGITPDVVVPWTPEHLSADIDLQRALETLGMRR